MSKNRPVRDIRYFLAELLILIIGITASFALNEYRVQKREQNQERELILNFKSNLISDSLLLSSGSDIIKTQIEAAQRLLLLKPRTDYKDSIAIDMLQMMSYYPFEPNDITYQEMKSVGNTHIIQNDSLLTEIIGVYEGNYKTIKTWVEIDGDHVKQKIIQYVMDGFPYAYGLNYNTLSVNEKSQVMNKLTSDKYKYLIQFGLAYKSSTKGVLDQALKEIRGIISMIDEELAK